MDIVTRVQQLALPLKEAVVVGSGSLAALGILDEATDIDLAVSHNVYQELKQSGWEEQMHNGNRSILV